MSHSLPVENRVFTSPTTDTNRRRLPSLLRSFMAGAGRYPRFIWGLNLSAMMVLAAWFAIDPGVDLFFARRHLFLQVRSVEQLHSFTEHSDFMWRLGLLLTIANCGMASFAVLTCGLYGRYSGYSGVRAQSGYWSLLALWIAVAFNQSNVAWHGKQARALSSIGTLEQLAADLRDHWPQEDGNRSALGSFMAYPVGRPSTLILLTPPQISDGGITVCVVEHAPTGALRFQLSGTEFGDWLEWHPPGQQPAYFVGGLLNTHRLIRHDKIADRWFLVRYDDR
ncbi:hypothetical protein [Fuerstiella marisgermanici]|uniref:Uncharacterized protein n=1 Tax=Fuerstiella marisgermanici TaxID=1891926 RepID=A0A1P8WR08_9PLAN|nr:hypothetical protein [Fuerstiella marisgermanici]APZ96494.1 hypothetical protein Fuma_06163 [Fuerstiella marisgermanici]